MSWVRTPDICMRRRTRCSVTTAPDDGKGAWRCSATVRGLVAKEVDSSGLRGRTSRSSAGQWKSELCTREGFQSLQSAIDAFPRLKWMECTDRPGNAALCRVDISTPELLSWKCWLWLRYVRVSAVVNPSVVCNVCAPYSQVRNFRQCFYTASCTIAIRWPPWKFYGHRPSVGG